MFNVFKCCQAEILSCNTMIRRTNHRCLLGELVAYNPNLPTKFTKLVNKPQGQRDRLFKLNL